MSDIAIHTKGINKYFHDPKTIHVLKDVGFDIYKGEFVSIIGKSGCGKSTLLYILSTMDTDFEGELTIDGQNMKGRSGVELARIRNEKIGFVFQFHYLLNEFSVLKNVMLPALKLGKLPSEQIEAQAIKKLELFGMGQHIHKKAHQLSGGEKQRVAIARALINDPIIIMGDEPSGNLDKKNGKIVFDFFQEIVQNFRQTLLVVTHDPEFAERSGRVIEMDDGRIVRS